MKREVLQNSSEQTPDLGVDQNSNLPCYYRATFIGCYEVQRKLGQIRAAKTVLWSNSTTLTRPSPFTYTVYCVLIGSTSFAQLVGYWAGTSLEVF